MQFFSLDATTESSSETVNSMFSSFLTNILHVLSTEDFTEVRRRCLDYFRLTDETFNIANKIRVTENLSNLFDVMCRCYKPNWNWMKIQVIEKMAGDCVEAKELIDQYKNKLFCKRVNDVLLEISELEIPEEGYTIIIEKLNEIFDNFRIKDVFKELSKIEKLLDAKGTILLKNITDGCVEICWLLPESLVKRAVCLAQPNKSEFSELLFFKIGDVIIKDDITSKMLIKLFTHNANHKQSDCTEAAL